MNAYTRRQNAIATIIVSSVLIVLLTAALVFGILFTYVGRIWNGLSGWNGFTINFGLSGFAGGSDYSTDPCVVSTEQIRSLDIAWASGSVDVIAEEGRTEIEISESGDNSTHKLCWKQGGDTLYLRYTDQWSWGLIVTHYPAKSLTVKIPAGMELSKVDLDIAASKTALTGLNMNNLKYDGASGGMTATDCVIRDKCDVDSASGAIRFENVICGYLDADMASGGIYFSGEVNEVNQDSASGRAEYRLSNCPKKIDIDSASGGVTIWLPADAGFDAEMDAASGKIICGFPDARTSKRSAYRNGDQICKIDMDSASGNLTIYPNE